MKFYYQVNYIHYYLKTEAKIHSENTDLKYIPYSVFEKVVSKACRNPITTTDMDNCEKVSQKLEQKMAEDPEVEIKRKAIAAEKASAKDLSDYKKRLAKVKRQKNNNNP